MNRPDQPPQPLPAGAVCVASQLWFDFITPGGVYIHCADLCEAIKFLDYAGMFGVTYNPGVAHPDLPAGEKGILEFTAPDGLRFVFSEGGFTFPDHGFIPYQDVFRADWPYSLQDRPGDYQNYLVISFRDRPPIKVYAGIQASSLSHLIIMMRALTRGQPKKIG